MECLVGQVDLLPPRRSTLHPEALSAASPASAAAITAAQARGDVAAIGWVECPIGCVAAFGAPGADAPEPVERVPRPADFVLAGRRPRSRRTRRSAYGPPSDVAASTKVKAGAPRKTANAIVKEEQQELSSLPPPLHRRFGCGLPLRLHRLRRPRCHLLRLRHRTWHRGLRHRANLSLR